MSGCSHRPVVAPLVAVPHVLQSALRFPHPCLQPPALLYSFPINQSIARLLFYRWPFLIFGRLFLKPLCLLGSLFSFFRFFIFVFLCIFLFFSFFVCVFLVLNFFCFFLYFYFFLSFLSFSSFLLTVFGYSTGGLSLCLAVFLYTLRAVLAIFLAYFPSLWSLAITQSLLFCSPLLLFLTGGQIGPTPTSLSGVV